MLRSNVVQLPTPALKISGLQDLGIILEVLDNNKKYRECLKEITDHVKVLEERIEQVSKIEEVEKLFQTTVDLEEKARKLKEQAEQSVVDAKDAANAIIATANAEAKGIADSAKVRAEKMDRDRGEKANSLAAEKQQFDEASGLAMAEVEDKAKELDEREKTLDGRTSELEAREDVAEKAIAAHSAILERARGIVG